MTVVVVGIFEQDPEEARVRVQRSKPGSDRIRLGISRAQWVHGDTLSPVQYFLRVKDRGKAG